MNARRALLFLLIAPVLMASKCKKVKDDEGGDRIISALPDPSIELQVAGIDPAYGPSGEAFSAEVLGAAFELGSTVNFAGAAATQVSWKDSSTLGLLVPALEPGYYDVTVSTPSGTRPPFAKGSPSPSRGGQALDVER